MEIIEPGLPEVTLEQGFSYIKKGDLERAISVMDELIAKDPYLAQAYWGRALCREYMAVGSDDIDRAIEDYSKCIVYSSEPSALSYGRRGILYFKSGRYDEALSDLNKALEADIFWVEARFYRGRTYMAIGREDDLVLADNDFGEVIRHMAEPFAPAYFWRAQARRLLGRSEEAVRDYECAIEIDTEDVLALNALAYCSEHGVGTKKNRTRAEKLYKRAASQGFTIAQKNLAWFYADDENGDGEDAVSSAQWMRKAAVSGDAEAQNLYGLRRLYGKGVKRDACQAFYYFGLSARQGYAPGMCNLADCYEQGVGVEKDEAFAFEIYQKAAETGYDAAVYNVGRYYYFGIGVDEDNDRAFETLKPLADEGYARAQDIVGMCYENGFGVGRDYRLAGKYFRAAYSQGHIHAGTHLAARYHFGRGVRKNLAEAVRLYKEAGEKGSAFAWFALGKLYFDDKRDYEKAVDAFRHAAENKMDSADIWIARSLMNTKHPEKHLDEIYSLLKNAAENGGERLHAAIFLCDLEYYGLYGFKINPEASVERVRELMEPDAKDRLGLSCAYNFLAQASELGLGVPRDAQKAAELYIKSGITAGAEAGGCRCYVASLAHAAYQGIGCAANRAEADGIIQTEMNEGNPSGEVRLLYIWSRLTSDKPADNAELLLIAESLLREEPHNVLAAYMVYYLCRDGNGAKKSLSRLKKIMKNASSYFIFMIELQLQTAPEIPLYPMLTAGIIDAYKKKQKP